MRARAQAKSASLDHVIWKHLRVARDSMTTVDNLVRCGQPNKRLCRMADDIIVGIGSMEILLSDAGEK